MWHVRVELCDSNVMVFLEPFEVSYFPYVVLMTLCEFKISLCGFVTTLYGFAIMLYGFVTKLLGFVTILLGYILAFCGSMIEYCCFENELRHVAMLIRYVVL